MLLHPPQSSHFSAIVVLSTMLASISFVVVVVLLRTILSAASSSSLNLTLPHQHPHPHPQSVIDDLHRRVNASITRRQMLGDKAAEDSSQCLTGNPIDDCWKCDDWPNNRKRLADCAVGFGAAATGGKGGQIYTVTDSSDIDVVNPIPGTLRYAVIQEQPLWIIFATDMTIKLKHELILTSYKTLDGRGRQVHITGNGCLTLQYISDVIIHNIHIHHCKPSGNVIIRSSPTHVGFRGRSDGDGISISGSRNIWIDHCSLSYCTDGLIDAIMGSTAITISNNYFSNHNDVMLFGHNDEYLLDVGMQITIAFNRFGERLVQRMPRCRRGLIHVVNNDFTGWGIYAIGGSANPTINSQGNRYTAPSNTDAKEVTKRVDTDANGWSNWNWRSEGDIMVNGAFFVPSGARLNTEYAPASSFQPKSAAYIDQFTVNVGVMGDSSGSNPIRNQGGYTSGSGGDGNTVYTGGNGNGGGEYFGFFGSNGVTIRTKSSIASPIVCLSLVVSSVFILIGPLRHRPM